MPGQSAIASLGSLARMPSPVTTVSAKSRCGKAVAARPKAIAVRRSIPFLLIIKPSFSLFSFCGQGVLFATMKRFLALLFLLAAQPVLADEGPAYGPRLEGFDYPFAVSMFKF